MCYVSPCTSTRESEVPTAALVRSWLTIGAMLTGRQIMLVPEVREVREVRECKSWSEDNWTRPHWYS